MPITVKCKYHAYQLFSSQQTFILITHYNSKMNLDWENIISLTLFSFWFFMLFVFVIFKKIQTYGYPDPLLPPSPRSYQWSSCNIIICIKYNPKRKQMQSLRGGGEPTNFPTHLNCNFSPSSKKSPKNCGCKNNQFNNCLKCEIFLLLRQECWKMHHSFLKEFFEA